MKAEGTETEFRSQEKSIKTGRKRQEPELLT